MKVVVLGVVFLIFSCLANAQVIEGELFNEGRKLAQPFVFSIEESTEGFAYYELAVDRLGKVTGARYLSDRSVALSTPAQVRTRNYVTSMKFEPGTYYPAFHHCIIRLNVNKKKAE